MSKIILYHGSDHRIEAPSYDKGKETNDYGKGFYCTAEIEMAKEWASRGKKNGFVNTYELDTDGLEVLDLQQENYTVLNWIAILLKHRTFNTQNEIAEDARKYVIDHFGIDIDKYDIVIGYRADDSYFAFAQSFINNTLPLRSLAKAMMLGKLGIQIALVSKKAFEHLKYVSSEEINSNTYNTKYMDRDQEARETYRNEIKKSKSYKDDIFVMDIIREEIENDDLRVQRFIFK